MNNAKKQMLPKSKLRPECNLRNFTFSSTDEINEVNEFIGQKRALEAMNYSVEMKSNSYHMFASGASSLYKIRFIEKYLRENLKARSLSLDWCYVYNFKVPYNPVALSFAAGTGLQFKNDMKAFIDQLIYAIPEMYESNEYISATEKINYRYKTEIEIKHEKLIKEARESDLLLVLKDEDYNIVPLISNHKMTNEQYQVLDLAEKRKIDNKIKKLKSRLGKMKDCLPAIYKEKHKKLVEVKNEFVGAVVKSLISVLKDKYTDPKVVQYLNELEQDIIVHPEEFQKVNDMLEIEEMNASHEKVSLLRYHVNLMVISDDVTVPIIYETNPDYINLVGQLEGTAQHGTLLSDITLIKPGSLHRANGGYLILEVEKLMKDTHAWEGLKRILLSCKIIIEPEGIKGTTQLQPEPIPLDIKIILLGDRYDYDNLSFEDNDFVRLFKILVDFEISIDRTNQNIRKFISFINFIILQKGLKPFHCDAVAELINYSIRLAGSSNKLSLLHDEMIELAEEANYWAIKNLNSVVYKNDICLALKSKEHRVDKIRDEFYEEHLSGHFLIDLKGSSIGQINAISVITLSNFSFGRPTKVTATVRSGRESIVDIQREVNLGGSNHSKGVLILNGYLKGKYAREFPFFLSASLVLEQTYGKVDGDSASLSELCALISSLSSTAIKQSIGVTGSVNQFGFVQSVGDINHKIEGFYNFCALKGLTGNQGVIIPKSNIINLMLNEEVVDACVKGNFFVYAVSHIDEALSILMDREPEDIHALCELNLIKFAKTRIGLLKLPI